MASPPAIDIDRLITTCKGLLAFTYTDVVSVAILIYDYSLTLPDEIKYIWTNPFAISSILFFLTRYPPFVDSLLLFIHAHAGLSEPNYKIVYRAQVGAYGIGILIGNVILLLRTTAIWERKKLVTLVLSVLLAACMAAAAYALRRYLVEVTFDPSPCSSDPGFFVMDNHNNLYIPYALLMGFETMVLVLTLVKASKQRAISQLHKTLYEDSLKYFVILFAVSVANTTNLAAGPLELRPVLTSVHRILHSVFTGRIILNIHESASGPSHAQSSSDFFHGENLITTVNLEDMDE